MDSIVRARSGQIIAIGGLMRNSTQRNNFSTPVLGRVPGLKRTDVGLEKPDAVGTRKLPEALIPGGRQHANGDVRGHPDGEPALGKGDVRANVEPDHFRTDGPAPVLNPEGTKRQVAVRFGTFNGTGGDQRQSEEQLEGITSHAAILAAAGAIRQRSRANVAP